MPGLSDRLLSQRLRELEEEGLVEREVEPGSPVRVTYSLTEAGAELRPAIAELRAWARRWKSADSRGEQALSSRRGRGVCPGPFAVGRYARKLQEELRRRARVRLVGEVTGVSRSKVQAYFELRDAEGAVPCAIWLNDLEQAGPSRGRPARRRRSRDRRRARLLPRRRPGLAELLLPRHPRAARRRGRPAGPARGAAQAAARRGAVRAAEAAGATAAAEDDRRGHRRERRRPARPARRPERRGWAGTVVWAFAPVQDRRAAPAIAAAIQELAARPEVEAIVVTRGGGSLADLWAFCDETLCRTVAMLRVPVISAVGHERDSTLIDDVAAVACSTPTHAAEAAVPLDCVAARRALERSAAALRPRRPTARSAAARRHLVALARGPARALRRERVALNQKTREIRAASERGLAERARLPAPARRSSSSTAPRRRAAGAELEQPARGAAPGRGGAPRPRTRAHPGARLRARRGPPTGEPVTSAEAARAAERD